ncbi:DEKNAAC104831 [Brettanomyces naardenensis]|uniref:DEKNAAC104831 n=1 Tax=Brettanomyces naardenensis TaxID=13370 RepID=A0A448YSJ7_BRENA|nr:DEKNAAC104831 [Brettanomyces naardenensis]
MGTDQEPDTKKLKGADLLLFQNVLKEVRLQTHSANKYMIELEDALIEQAAQLGNRDALTMLSFKALDDTTGEYTEDDKKHAGIFINELSKLKHPLVFKMGGDYHYRKQNLPKAVDLYKKFLKLDNDSFMASEVYRTLGMILFQQQKLMQAKVLMEKAINLAPASKVSQAHFMLGLINEIDPLKARYHFEMAASEGFMESFVNLGFLEMNYFNNLGKAKEWFKLGAELGDSNCMIGLFDCYMKEENWKNAKITYDKTSKFLKDTNSNVNLDELRATAIQQMNLRLSHRQDKEVTGQAQPAKDPVGNASNEKSRWDV